MINKSRINKALDILVGPSHNLRVWIGRLTKKEQLDLLGCYFGQCLIQIEEKSSSINFLKKDKNGPYLYKGHRHKKCASYVSTKPMLSKFDCAPAKGRAQILKLMSEYKSSKTLIN